MEITLPSPSNTLPNPAVSFHRTDNIRLGASRNLRLIDKFLLACDCPQEDGGYREVFLNLDACLGHKDGQFDRHGTDYSAHTDSVELHGMTLVAHWKQLEGGAARRDAMIALGTIVHPKDGVVVPSRSNVAPEDLALEVLHDTNHRQWLPWATNIRLVSYIQKRRWYIVAHTLNSHGLYREALFPLSEVVGPYYHSMFCHPLYRSPDIPESACTTRLHDGWLTASFDLQGNKGWLEKTIDLGSIMEVVPLDGSLAL
jgi:hypothetical protein